MIETIDVVWEQIDGESLLRGEVLLKTWAHSAWGAGVTAQIYLPLPRSLTWQKLADYPCWVQYFPDITQSEVLQSNAVEADSMALRQPRKRLYQAASKAFLFFNARVEIYLQVFEVLHRQIQFRLEGGSFADFSADLKLQDYEAGTLLTYTVQAAPLLPVPSLFLQQAIHLDFPHNLKQMRQVLCAS